MSAFFSTVFRVVISIQFFAKNVGLALFVAWVVAVAGGSGELSFFPLIFRLNFYEVRRAVPSCVLGERGGPCVRAKRRIRRGMQCR
jgi:hypothetical protein